MAKVSESKICSDCANLHSLCDACINMDRWVSMQKKSRKKPEDAPEAPVVHEDGTIEGHIVNPEALDALETCKHHGETVDVNEDGVTFCTECGLAVPTNSADQEEQKDCRDCISFDSGMWCDDCEGADIAQHKAGGNYRKDVPEASDEPNWDTFHDRSAEVPDPMMEEGQGEPQHALVPVNAPSEPWWAGGPLDTVTPEGESIGLPWHTAVLKLPAGQYLVLEAGDYNYGGIKATLSVPMRVDDPCEPDDVLRGMLMIAEQDAKAESVTEYRPGHNGQSTLDGEPMVRGRIDRKDVTQVHIEVDKYYLNTTEEGLAKALEEEKMSLKQWVYHKMRPLSMDTHIEDDDWKEGCKQFLKVIKGAA